MAGLDVSGLAASDVVAALRTYPRRYRAAVAVGPDEDVDELAGRVGPGGQSAHDLLVDATSTLMVLTQALRQVLQDDEPLLHPAVHDAGARQWAPPPGLGVDDLLGLLDDEVAELVALVDGVPTFDWSRLGRVADGPSLSALELAREAVRVGGDDLRGIDAAMAAARR